MDYKQQYFFKIQVFLTLLIALLPSLGIASGETIHLTLETAIARALRYNRNLRNDTLDLDNSQLNMDAALDVFDIKISPLSSIHYTSNPEEEQSVWRFGGLVSKKFKIGILLNLEPSIEKDADDYGAGVGFSLAIPLMRGLGKDINMDNVYANEYALASSGRTFTKKKTKTILKTEKHTAEIPAHSPDSYCVLWLEKKK